MGFKVFLDTNILVDFIDDTRKEHNNADLLFEEIGKGMITGFVSESVITTTSYLTSKLTTVGNFSLFLQSALQLLRILSCTNAIMIQACKMAKNDFEDAVLYSLALANRMDYFISNNKNDFKKISHPSLPVMQASELLQIL